MKKLLLIKTMALSAAIAATFGLASCNTAEGDPADTSSAVTTGTQMTQSNASGSQQETVPAETTEDPNLKMDYKAAKTIAGDTTEKNKKYSSANGDENALLVKGKKTVNLNAPTIDKSGDSTSISHSKLYGVNSAFLAIGSPKVLISGGTVTTKGKGVAGIFSYGGYGEVNGLSGDGTTVTVSDATVTTSGDESAAIMASGAGKLSATNVTALQGAAVRSTSPAATTSPRV